MAQSKKKTAKRKLASTKKSPRRPSDTSENRKGSVTRHLEALHGRTFTEGELINKLDEDLREAWEKLRGFAANLGDQRIYASAQSIMFAKKICYFYVRPKKKFLEVWFFLPYKIEGLTFMQGPGKKVKFCNMFKLLHADQVEEPLTDWLREAFDFAT